jgi:predicted DNA-binding transcriptional regulator AlpA
MNSPSVGGCPVTELPNTSGVFPLLIDAKAAQALLSIGERRLWVLTNCKAIPSRKIGKSVRYFPAELAAWVECGCPTEPGSAERVRREVRS